MAGCVFIAARWLFPVVESRGASLAAAHGRFIAAASLATEQVL